MNSPTPNNHNQMHKGVLAAFLCYAMWGSFPFYWKLLSGVDPFEIIAHRVIWCFVFVIILCIIMRQNFVSLLRDRRALKYLLPAAIIVTSNWSIYIFAVEIDHIVETAIGYYINPLVSILLGFVIFHERLSHLQSAAVVLCVIGITFFTISYGSFPWIAIALALTFGIYGAIKKKGGYPAIEALAVESTLMLVPALMLAVGLAIGTGSHAFLGATAGGEVDWRSTLLLIGGGAVTAIPLILFAKAANSIPLTLLGFIQYISPTIALLLGVFMNGEPFTLAHAVCLGFIWCGLALVGIDAALESRIENRKALR